MKLPQQHRFPICFRPTCWVLAATLLAVACAPKATLPAFATPRWEYDLNAPAATGLQGMVVTADSFASEVGLNVLQDGGNAVDAAVAVAFALAVTYPRAGNIGGGGFMVIRTADGETTALDFRETAPAGAHRDMYIDPDGSLNDRSLYGAQAAGVPGTVLGLWEVHQKFGSLPWDRLVAPAIELAEGFPAHRSFVESSKIFAEKLVPFGPERRREFQASIDKFIPGGKPPKLRTTIRQPDLAKTLRRIAQQGPDGFYRGETARWIVKAMREGGGIITGQDLIDYEIEWRDPIEFHYRGHRVVSMPPASSGGVTLAEIANILEGFELGELDYTSVNRVHLMAEAMRRGFADRNTYLGDPAFVSMPLARMISDDYAAERRASINSDRATPSTDVGPGLGPVDHGNDTTHYSIVDGQGNAVATTTTINTRFGSLVTVPGAGFLLNNEMDDFAAKPGHPNAYGLVQGELNAIAPGKRMLSSMTPTIVLDPQDRLLLITGTPGGSKIITGVLQSIVNAIDFGMDVTQLVNAPRMHHQHLPDRIQVEERGLPKTTLTALRAMGHRVETIDSMCNVQAILVRPDGTLTGAADPRGYGTARGF